MEQGLIYVIWRENWNENIDAFPNEYFIRVHYLVAIIEIHTRMTGDCGLWTKEFDEEWGLGREMPKRKKIGENSVGTKPILLFYLHW